jgi:hypothetical protein
MDAGTRAHLAQVLRRQRATLLDQFSHGEDGLRSIGEDRAHELEERAQEERAARVLVGVNELLWERMERSRTAPPDRVRPARFEPLGTEDVVESSEEGLDWMAPDRPPPEEE